MSDDSDTTPAARVVQFIGIASSSSASLLGYVVAAVMLWRGARTGGRGGALGWARRTWAIDDEDILSHGGSDALLYVRRARMNVEIAASLLLFGAPLAVVYATTMLDVGGFSTYATTANARGLVVAARAERENPSVRCSLPLPPPPPTKHGPDSLSLLRQRYTIANMPLTPVVADDPSPQGNARLWVTVAAAWFNTLAVMFILRRRARACRRKSGVNFLHNKHSLAHLMTSV